MCDRRAITFAIDDPFAARAAFTAAFNDAPEPHGPLEAVLREAAGNPQVQVRPIFPERSVGVLGGGQFHLALADPIVPNDLLSGIHLLRFVNPSSERAIDVVSSWRDALQTDSRVAYAEHPMIAYPVLDLTTDNSVRALGRARASPDRNAEPIVNCDPQQWGLRHCGFNRIWNELDTGVDPGPIGIVDMGAEPVSPELAGRIVKYVTPPGKEPHDGTHPAHVAGIISAIRDGSANETLLGCCSATLEVFSIYTKAGEDCDAFYNTLKAVGSDHLRVVNMSFESGCRDSTVDRTIKQYVRDGTIFVAAMGNKGGSSNPINWPAAHKDVIAVGATSNEDDDRWPDSCTGKHIFMSAPGFDIRTLDPEKDSGYGCLSGTSLAAPFVTAAIWLALRKRPTWGLKEIRCLLSRSVQDGSKSWNTAVGYGCLDVTKMAQLLREGVCD